MLPHAHPTDKQYSKMVVCPWSVVRHERYLICKRQEVAAEISGCKRDNITVVAGILRIQALDDDKLNTFIANLGIRGRERA